MIIKKNYPFLSTTPSTDMILHPLFHYPLYATLTFDSIPPYHPHSTHPPWLYLSLSLLINYTLLYSSPPFIKPHRYRPICSAYTSPYPFLSTTPSLITPPSYLDYSFLSLGFAFSSLALAPGECLSPFLSDPDFFSLYSDLDFAFSSLPLAPQDCLSPHGFAK